MTIESKRATLVRLAAEAGLGQYLLAEPGLPGTWWGTDLDALERFAKAVLIERAMHAPPVPLLVNLPPERLEELRRALREAPPMPLMLMPDEPDAQSERAACLTICRQTATPDATPYGDGYNQAALDIEAAIAARGAA